MASVNVSWHWFKWQFGYKWHDILPQLEKVGLTEHDLERSVYVIRAAGSFAINYKYGASPTLYIGEGNFKQRIVQHRTWLEPLVNLVGEFPISIGVSIPKLKYYPEVYKYVEAALIQEFISEYGCLPLKNRHKEYPRHECQYEPTETLRSAIMIGKGYRYQWALEPLRANRFYEDYIRGFD